MITSSMTYKEMYDHLAKDLKKWNTGRSITYRKPSRSFARQEHSLFGNGTNTKFQVQTTSMSFSFGLITQVVLRSLSPISF